MTKKKKKSIFLGWIKESMDLMRMRRPKCASPVPHFGGSHLTVSIETGASNGRCSDAMTLPVGDWLLFRRRELFRHIARCTFSHSKQYE